MMAAGKKALGGGQIALPGKKATPAPKPKVVTSGSPPAVSAGKRALGGGGQYALPGQPNQAVVIAKAKAKAAAAKPKPVAVKAKPAITAPKVAATLRTPATSIVNPTQPRATTIATAGTPVGTSVPGGGVTSQGGPGLLSQLLGGAVSVVPYIILAVVGLALYMYWSKHRTGRKRT